MPHIRTLTRPGKAETTASQTLFALDAVLAVLNLLMRKKGV